MAIIGRVYKDTFENKQIIKLEIRTITIKKTFTISANTHKWGNGQVGKDKPVQGQEHKSDYLIWANVAKRGETLPSEIVGGVKDMVGAENQTPYKQCHLIDPFIQKEPICFKMFSVSEDKKLNKNHIYNAVI